MSDENFYRRALPSSDLAFDKKTGALLTTRGDHVKEPSSGQRGICASANQDYALTVEPGKTYNLTAIGGWVFAGEAPTSVILNRMLSIPSGGTRPITPLGDKIYFSSMMAGTEIHISADAPGIYPQEDQIWPIMHTYAVDGQLLPSNKFTRGELPPDITFASTEAPYPPANNGPYAITAYGREPAENLIIVANVSRFGGDSDCGVMLKFDPIAMTGYGLFIDFHSTSGVVDIMKLTGAGGNVQIHVQQGSITNWDKDGTYQLVFKYLDGQLDGKVYNSSGVNVCSVTGNDSDYSANTYCGVLAVTNIFVTDDGGIPKENSTRGRFEDVKTFKLVSAPL